MNTLLELAARCEAAEGPDWNIDVAIALAITGKNGPRPSYTASLDAAMTLVPEGCGWTGGSGRPFHVWRYAHHTISEYGDAATPALALCAAALKARASADAPNPNPL